MKTANIITLIIVALFLMGFSPATPLVIPAQFVGDWRTEIGTLHITSTEAILFLDGASPQYGDRVVTADDSKLTVGATSTMFVSLVLTPSKTYVIFDGVTLEAKKVSP